MLDVHKRLGEKHGIYTVVYARVLCVTVGNSEELPGSPGQWGKKFTFKDDDNWDDYGQAHDRTNSKLKLYWSNGQQQRSVIT